MCLGCLFTVRCVWAVCLQFAVFGLFGDREGPEGGGQAEHVPLPLGEGGEGGDAVADEMVREAQHCQVHVRASAVTGLHRNLRDKRKKWEKQETKGNI